MYEDLPLLLAILSLAFILVALAFDSLLAKAGYDSDCPQKTMGNLHIRTLLFCRTIARVLVVAMVTLFALTFVLAACTYAL